MIPAQQTDAANSPYSIVAIEVSHEDVESPRKPPLKLRYELSECVVYRVYSGDGLDETFYDISVPQKPDGSKKISDVNAERLSLLAEKYVGDYWSREMEARLQIDHKKVIREFPRSDAEQNQRIEDLRQALNQNSHDLERLLDDLGIK